MTGTTLGSGEVALNKRGKKYSFRCGLYLVGLKESDNKRNKLNCLICQSDKCCRGK